MSDPDVSHSCPNMTKYLIQEESEDPGSRFILYATGDVNIRHRLLA